MMTCVSVRSGIASSGVRLNACRPKPTPTRTPAIVIARLRAHHPMTRSIIARLPLARRGAQPALGGDEEVAGHDHALAGGDAAEHLVVAAGARAEPDLTRREPAVAEIHEHEPALAGRQNRALRHGKPL